MAAESNGRRRIESRRRNRENLASRFRIRLPLSAFGGLPGSGTRLGLKATGFFHVEKHDDRWLLVDPAGNAFFHFGLCGAAPSDDYTLVKGREAAYEWLPSPEGEFATAFQKESASRVVSFYIANRIRKYGQPYDRESYTAQTIPRLRQWGFNSFGAFTDLDNAAQKTAHFPRLWPIFPWGGMGRDFAPAEYRRDVRSL